MAEPFLSLGPGKRDDIDIRQPRSAGGGKPRIAASEMV